MPVIVEACNKVSRHKNLKVEIFSGSMIHDLKKTENIEKLNVILAQVSKKSVHNINKGV